MLENLEYIENDLSYEIYYKLRDSVGWRNFSEQQARNALQHSYYSIVVLHQNEAIGMARIIGDGIYFIIADVIVVPEYQGKGIGTTMMKRLLAYIDENVPVGGRASVQLIAEKGKEVFYAQQGFKRMPHEHCGSGMRKVIYKE